METHPFNLGTWAGRDRQISIFPATERKTKMWHCLRLLLYCYDKTLTKNNSGRKGFISASSYDLSWREAGTGTPGNNPFFPELFLSVAGEIVSAQSSGS